MSRINVLWVIDHVCYDGSLHGGGRLYWNIVPRFDRDRFRIVPCMLRATGTIRGVFTESPVPVRILDKGKFDPTTLWTFLRLLRQENIHVMHLHCYGSSTFGRLAGLLAGVPTVIHDYDTEVYFPYPWYLWAADRMLAPITQAAVAASPMVRDFLVNKRRIKSERILMMLHAIPPEKYNTVSGERVFQTRQRLEIDGNTKIIGTLTKLGPQRGNEYLLKAAGEVLTVFPNALFLVVYKPTYFHRLPNQSYVQVAQADASAMVAQLKALVRELGIEKNVRLIESSENTDELLSACDLVVAPFLSERFSSVNLLEAMAMGKPLIATDIGEQREIIRNGVNGYLVPPGNVEQLAQRILAVLMNPNEFNRLSHQAKTIAEQYSVDAYVRGLERLYTRLTTNKGFYKKPGISQLEAEGRIE
jgi:glycosyltransferase involved in cell wall biosynthesis